MTEMLENLAGVLRSAYVANGADCKMLARAALSVLREPNQDMLNAARDWSFKKYGQGVGNDGAVGCWQAMIDAVLGKTSMSEPEVSPISRPAYQQRVMEEKADLDGKLARLNRFIGHGTYRALTPREQHLLHQQAWAMRSYQAALRDRIEMWG